MAETKVAARHAMSVIEHSTKTRRDDKEKRNSSFSAGSIKGSADQQGR